jgi:putative membrane protein
MKLSPFAVVLIAILLAVGAWSLVSPLPFMAWFLEVAPAMIGGVAIAIAWFRFGFAFTRLVCVLLAVHAVILMVGGKYTYALNPLFDWIKDALGLARNHYDRLGHFAQGFIPALVAREVLLRASPLKPGKWLFFIVASICLAASAFYELVEWWVAVGTADNPRTAIDFLGSQGDVWDAQWDMCMCLIGAITSQLALGRVHDRAIARRLSSRPRP